MFSRLKHIPKVEARAAVLSLGLGGILLGGKFVAYVMTGSAAVFADALESVVNVLTAGFALYALWLAHTPADKEHPYGHGKVEFLSAGFEGGMMLLAAAVMVVEGAEALRRGRPVQARLIGAALLVVAMAANGWLGIYLLQTGRRNKALSLEADGKHLLSDAITSVVALAALALVRLTGWKYADPLGAMLVAIYVARTGLLLLRRAAAGLMDEQEPADQILLENILDAHANPGKKQPRICSYHKLRHRHTGRYHWVDFHLVVPAWWDVALSHRVAGEIEYEIETALGEGDATAHVEPCINPECVSCREAAMERENK